MSWAIDLLQRCVFQLNFSNLRFHIIFSPNSPLFIICRPISMLWFVKVLSMLNSFYLFLSLTQIGRAVWFVRKSRIKSAKNGIRRPKISTGSRRIEQIFGWEKLYIWVSCICVTISNFCSPRQLRLTSIFRKADLYSCLCF